MHTFDRSYKITDEQVEALKAGNHDALQQLFMQMQPRLYHFLWLKTKSVETAEDLVQETFLRLWDNRRRLKTGTNLTTYLFRIASNLATDVTRRNERHRELEQDNLESANQAESTDGQMDANQLAKMIDAIVSGLPEAQRAAFILSRFEGLPHREVAAVMSISVKTVEKHLAKALQKIRKHLDSLGIRLPP